MTGRPQDRSRAVIVQQLFDDDVSGLRAYEASPTTPSIELQLVESGASLSKDDLGTCIDLVETTSGKDYRASSMGWHRGAKAEEMTDPEMIFLLLRDSAPGVDTQSQTLPESSRNDTSRPRRSSKTSLDRTQNPASPPRTHTGRIIGFVSFMFTNDDPPHEDREVVYIYEVHLAESLRGQGLGSDLIRFAEQAAVHCGISKTMLTVFTANAGAKALYERLGYEKDACSPRDKVMRRKVIKADYVIMSKELAGSLV
ncbi:acyl-CoA N-acyltransferase [Plenodomus tracheiphilus IPT5]|uniref:N-alpha-acetyltransferase 40 n=1 Tax=Plenodomus tracheiphilus IPT5 TaxID=1408161 RepID=A0A6A7BGJ3_9PLEO|nr:acyl-CoA N-acyltransferase [Plenodomus tracheiphilus IPT5]